VFQEFTTYVQSISDKIALCIQKNADMRSTFLDAMRICARSRALLEKPSADPAVYGKEARSAMTLILQLVSDSRFHSLESDAEALASREFQTKISQLDPQTELEGLIRKMDALQM
jgi:hypothetical protein